jgi:hypothetical protein
VSRGQRTDEVAALRRCGSIAERHRREVRMRTMLFVVAAAALVPVTLRAGPVPAPVSDHEHPATVTYATPILAVSLAGLAVPWVSGGPGGWLGLGTYALGPPIIHLSHHNPGRAAGSLGLRLALPLLGMFVGSSIDKASERKDAWYPGLFGAFVGFYGGGVAASVIDAVWLAREGRLDAARSSSGASLRVADPAFSFAVSPRGAAFAVRF